MTYRQCSCGSVVSWWVGSCPRCWSDLTEPQLVPPTEPRPGLRDSTMIATAFGPRTEPALLDKLVEAARHYRMTPAEKRAQRISFVYGQVGPGISKERIAEILYGAPPPPSREGEA
jgi:hypothetical protein